MNIVDVDQEKKSLNDRLESLESIHSENANINKKSN
jgi:hypothetical protein